MAYPTNQSTWLTSQAKNTQKQHETQRQLREREAEKEQKKNETKRQQEHQERIQAGIKILKENFFPPTP